MSNPRFPSPARSQSAVVTPRRSKPRRTLSVGSPARSTASGRLSAIIQLKENGKNSFVLSPIPTRRSVLNDDSNIEEPRRRSWWKRLDHSRDVMEVLNDNKILETNEIVEELIDIEVLSQEKKNYSLDLPESSDSESISSIVIPQRKLFTQKDMQSQDKFAPLMGTRETLSKLHKSVAHEKTILVPPKNLFNQPSKPKPRPVFPADLLNISPNKTANKTKELTTVQVTGQTRNIFGNRSGTKRKNMFAEFIMSESEDELSEIQPKIFGFAKKGDMQKETSTDHRREPSPTSSITADIEMDDWKLLPSSTMVENQLEDMMAAAKSPGRRTRLTKLSELLDSETETANIIINKRKQSNKSVSKNKSKDTVEPNNEPEVNKSALLRNKSRISPNKIENNRSTRKNKAITSQIEVNEPEEIDEIINSEPPTAKRLRLSNSPEKNNTSKSVKNTTLNASKRLNKSINKNLSKISSENQLYENEAEKSILKRSKTKNISNNSLQFDNLITAQESDNDVQAPNSESNEDDELNMSLVYDEQDEIDSINSNQKESILTSDASKKSSRNKPNESNEKIFNQDKSLSIAKNFTQTEVNHKGKVNSHETGIENNNIDIKKSYALNKNDEVIAEVSNKCHKEKRIESQKDPIEEVENVNNIEDLSANDNQEENQASRSENYKENQIEVRKLNEEESREDNNDNNQEYIESEVTEDQDNEINQDVSRTDQDVSQEEEMEADDNNEAKDESSNVIQESDNESLAEDNDEQENEESHEIEDDNQEINVEQKKEETVELEQKVDEIDEGNEEMDSEIKEDNDEVEQEIEEENEELENSSREAEADNDNLENTIEEANNEELEETGQEVEAHNDESEETEQEVEADNEELEETNQEVEINNKELDETGHEVEEDNEELEETDQEVEVDNEESEVNDQEDAESDEEPEQEEQNSEQEVDESDREQENVSQEEEELEEESQELEQNDSNEEIEGTNEDVEPNENSPNVSHDTTGRHRNKENKIDSPEVILHDKTKQLESFTASGRNTSLRRTSILKNMNIRPSLAPPRDSTGFSDSSAEGSGWDSHRTTRKTLRQTFGKDFTPRKSLRALVMEKSAKRQTGISDLTTVTSKFPQANSTELPEATNIHEDNDSYDAPATGSVHDISKRTRQTTLENYLQKIKKQNMERRMKIEENVKNSLKAPIRDISNTLKVPAKPMFAIKKSNTRQPKKAKQVKSSLIPLDDLPPEVIDDMKYKPPKRYQPSNAAWITKRLYKFLETKLEPKYDYKARIRAEKLVEAIYQFAKELRRHPAASSDSVDHLKHEMARLDVVKTHFDFYQFFHDYMPREIRVKVIPDVMNKLPLPRHGVFSEILRVNTVQG